MTTNSLRTTTMPADLSPGLSRLHSLVSGDEPELSGLRARLGGPLIAHVGDEPSMIELVSLVMRREGRYRYVGFTDGAEALAFCRQSRPALLITDLSRPGLSGVELIDYLRADDRLADLPVLIVSASVIRPWMPMWEWARRCAVEQICKPFTYRDLLKTLAAMLSNPPARHTRSSTGAENARPL